MKRSGVSVWLLSGIFTLGGCSAGEASTSPPPSELGPPSALRVVEVTTVTTVQGSSGDFLSPRPSVVPPAYLEPGSAAPSVSFPEAPSATDRAKLETTLLFQADGPGSASFHLDASLSSSDGS